MSKEPLVRNTRMAAGTFTSVPGAPYTSSSAVALQPQPAAGGPPRLTINNFITFHAREKKLPPDANVKAALNTKLWQFSERVCFGCAKCRRDNVQSDSVAIDFKNNIMLCTACFTRIIRPRTYRPSRVVPFPSLLSWLNYKPSQVMSVSEDIMSRPAEAVAPSGDRIAAPLLANGDRPTKFSKLPAVAMNMVPTGRTGGSHQTGSLAQEAQSSGNSRHPCLRVWGVCQHGGTCLFRNAPVDLCLPFLMGLCDGDKNRCRLLHQSIYDLPNPVDPSRPPVRYVGDLEDEESAWSRWISKKRSSPNSAEWQLWHNGAIAPLMNSYVPASQRPEAANAPAETEDDVKLNITDIMSALRNMSVTAEESATNDHV